MLDVPLEGLRYAAIVEANKGAIAAEARDCFGIDVSNRAPMWCPPMVRFAQRVPGDWNKVKALDLPSIPAGTLRSAEHWLWRFLPKSKLALGGGTVLAARWKHRESTDVDLFAPSGALVETDAAMHALSVAVRERLCDGRLADGLVGKRHLRLTFPAPAGELSVFTGANATTRAIAANESAAGLAVHSTEEILARKLMFRVHGLGEFTQRDFYDFAVAALQEPAAMTRVLSQFDIEANRAVARELSAEPFGFQSRPLLAAAYPGLAESTDLRRCARRLFEDGVEAMSRQYRRHRNGRSR